MDSMKTGESLNKNSYGVIKEDIFAAYVQGDFSGDDYRGNLGLRYVQTDTSADFFLQDDNATEDSDYADWLPSFPSRHSHRARQSGLDQHRSSERTPP